MQRLTSPDNTASHYIPPVHTRTHACMHTRTHAISNNNHSLFISALNPYLGNFVLTCSAMFSSDLADFFLLVLIRQKSQASQAWILNFSGWEGIIHGGDEGLRWIKPGTYILYPFYLIKQR